MVLQKPSFGITTLHNQDYITEMSPLDQIKALVFELKGPYEFELTSDTLLQKDLGIYGDDAPEFIEQFAQLFDIDTSEFDYTNYFTGEGGVFTPWLVPNHDFGKKPLTLGNLEAAIASKKLR